MHKIRSAGPMWPAEAFYLARKVQNFFHSAGFLEKTPSEWVKVFQFWPLDLAKNKNLACLRFELCTPDLTLPNQTKPNLTQPNLT